MNHQLTSYGFGSFFRRLESCTGSGLIGYTLDSFEGIFLPRRREQMMARIGK
jgi:hypothetical protein